MQGERLGAYLIDRELGSGGMGKVYAATGPDGVVALKVVHPHLLETPGFFKRFMREAQVGQSIRHENVVRTLDCDQEFGGGKSQCFLVMEYVEGQTLSELLHELDRVPEELCRHVAREICKGLAAVHEEGVVHRDLKPENVLITPEHVVKVMDLGVAQVADEALRLSKSGAFVGSVEYAAPEQFKGGDVDGRTDLHALGVLLYELSSGAHPYRGGGFHEVLTRVCDAAPRRLGEVNPQLSAFFEEVVHTLLVKDPRGRFASATQLLRVLEQGEDSAWWHECARRLQSETKRPLRRIRIPRETGVYGRDAELATLRALFEAAKSGDGRVVLLEGEAGIGKSRLVDELVGRLHAEGEDLNFLFGSYPPGGAATSNGALSSAFHEHLGEAGAASHLTETPLLVPAFDALLRGDAPPPGAERLRQEALSTCFVHATRSLAAERPTVLLVDDLHFAPDEARALFSALAMSVPGRRVLLVGTLRPGVSEEWRAGLTRLDHATLVPLHRLGPKDLVRLLAETLGSAHLAEELAGKIAVKSDGNPFFAFEILRGLRDGAFLTQSEDGSWTTTRVIDDIQIPSSVLDLVSARVAGLTEDERALLDVASCWGYEFDPSLIGEVLGMARIPVLRAFGQLERLHRLVRSTGRQYVFDHHQVQETLYGSLNEQLREEYHAALAEAHEAKTNALGTDPNGLDGSLRTELCEHFLLGARGGKALRYLESAQSHLRDSWAHERMVNLTERALAVPGLLTGTARGESLLMLIRALHSMGRSEREGAFLVEARSVIAELDAPLLHAGLELASGHFLVARSRLEEARTALLRSQSIAREHGNHRGELAATQSLARLLTDMARHDEADAQIGRWRAIAIECRDRGEEGRVVAWMGTALWQRGRLVEARTQLERAIVLLHESAQHVDEGAAMGNLGNVLRAQGQLEEAIEHFERYWDVARQAGLRQSEASALINLGTVRHLQGRIEESMELYERCLALAREIDSPRSKAVALVNLGMGYHDLGDLVRSRAALEECLEICRAIGIRYPEGYALEALGSVAHHSGDLDEALQRTEEAVSLRREIRHADGLAESLLQLGFLRRVAGDLDGARLPLLEALGCCRAQGRDHEVVLSLVELAFLPGGDVTAAESALEEAGDSADSMRVRWFLYQLTGSRAHLEAAKRFHDDALAARRPEARARLLAAGGMHASIDAAWLEEFGDAPPDAGDPPGTESVTRAG